MQFESFATNAAFTVTWCFFECVKSISNSAMRVVRFYLEPWQKGGTPSPSASLLLLSPKIRRRQRLFPMSDESTNKSVLRKLSCGDKDEERKKTRRRSLTLKKVKSLSSLCSDVLVENVSDCIINHEWRLRRICKSWMTFNFQYFIKSFA